VSRGTSLYFASSIQQLGYTPACSSYFAKASQMIGVPSPATAARCSRLCCSHPTPHCGSIASVRFLSLHHQLPRSNQLAYAALGMARDLGFDDRVLGLGIGIFFLSCVALQIPGAVLAQRWSARGVFPLSC
jgi:hypothetical protein